MEDQALMRRDGEACHGILPGHNAVRGSGRFVPLA